MRRKVEAVCFVLAFISIMAGFGDVIYQFLQGQDPINWRFPLILIGFGAGLPILLFPFYKLPPEEESDKDENAHPSEYQSSHGVLSNISEGGSGSNNCGDTYHGDYGNDGGDSD